jgi:hypothetical protein
LLNFAKSPFDLLGYDRNVAYQPQFEQFEVDNESESRNHIQEISSGSEGEDVVISEPAALNLSEPSAAEPDINNLSGEIEIEPQPGPSGINQSDNSPVFCINKEGKIARAKTDIVLSSDDDDDDVQFVLALKPPEQRTPEMISLKSESDSDVIFVDDSNPAAKPSLELESESSDDIPLAKLKTEVKPQSTEETETHMETPLISQPQPVYQQIPVPGPSNEELPGTTEAKCPRKKFYNRSIKQMYHDKRNYSSSSSSTSSDSSDSSSSDSDFEIGELSYHLKEIFTTNWETILKLNF